MAKIRITRIANLKIPPSCQAHVKFCRNLSSNLPIDEPTITLHNLPIMFEHARNQNFAHRPVIGLGPFATDLTRYGDFT